MTEVKEICWKNLKGIQIENEVLSTVVLPSLGSKIASIYRKDKDFELAAQHAGSHYRIPGFGADFAEYDASGLDDAFPNINRAEVVMNGEKYFYPDHGEIWSSRFETELLKHGAALYYQSILFGYEYVKRIFLKEDRIILEYEIHNMKTRPFPCIWTFHGLVRYEEDMEFLYGSDVEEFRNVFESRELGEVNRVYRRRNGIYDFRKVPDIWSKTMVKYYSEGKVKNGFCGYRYPSHRLECKYYYDPGILPYLGVWITAGGFRGDYNCALEPANGYYDDIRIAEKNQSLYYLEKGKPLKFSLVMEIRGY